MSHPCSIVAFGRQHIPEWSRSGIRFPGCDSYLSHHHELYGLRLHVLPCNNSWQRACWSSWSRSFTEMESAFLSLVSSTAISVHLPATLWLMDLQWRGSMGRREMWAQHFLICQQASSKNKNKALVSYNVSSYVTDQLDLLYWFTLHKFKSNIQKLNVSHYQEQTLN